MSVVSRAFVPVSMKNGKCPNDEWHFNGAAKEIYSYLRLLGKGHGGFVFAGLKDITRHTKKWSKGKAPFSQRQCERIVRIFQALRILGDRETRIIHGREYSGWQLASHDWWAEEHGGFCDFVHWEKYSSQGQKFMGNNDGPNVGPNVGFNDDQNDLNDGPDDGATSVVLNLNAMDSKQLQERAAS